MKAARIGHIFISLTPPATRPLFPHALPSRSRANMRLSCPMFRPRRRSSKSSTLQVLLLWQAYLAQACVFILFIIFFFWWIFSGNIFWGHAYVFQHLAPTNGDRFFLHYHVSFIWHTVYKKKLSLFLYCPLSSTEYPRLSGDISGETFSHSKLLLSFLALFISHLSSSLWSFPFLISSRHDYRSLGAIPNEAWSVSPFLPLPLPTPVFSLLFIHWWKQAAYC